MEERNSSFEKPKLTISERIKKNRLLKLIEKRTSQSEEELENNQKAAKLRKENLYSWYKLPPATKATLIVNSILTFILICITAVTVVQQMANNSIAEAQNKTNDETLKLLQKEFMLNYRPYIDVSNSAFEINNDSILFTFVVENYGKVPGIINFSTKGDGIQMKNEINYLKSDPIIIFPGNKKYVYPFFAGKNISTISSIEFKIIYRSFDSDDFDYYTTYNYFINLQDKRLNILTTSYK